MKLNLYCSRDRHRCSLCSRQNGLRVLGTSNKDQGNQFSEVVCIGYGPLLSATLGDGGEVPYV
jgi:hypothetical protein